MICEEDFPNLVFNIGPNRTGSSIVSRLIATFDDFDLVYEPTTLYCLMALLEQNAPRHSTQRLEELIRIFVKEDLLLPRLAGRSLNHNPHDLSSDVNLLAQEQMALRNGVSWGRAGLLERFPRSRFLIKYGYPFAQERLTRIFRNATFVTTFRNPFEVAYSILQKRWFEPEVFSVDPAYAFDENRGRKVPAWLPEDFLDRWPSMPALDRSCLYTYVSLRRVLASKGVLLIAYEDLVSDVGTVVELVERLTGSRRSARTMTVMDSIQADVSRVTRSRAHPYVCEHAHPDLLRLIETLPTTISSAQL